MPTLAELVRLRRPDLTLIRWMLSLTPAERVERIEDLAASLEELRELNRER